LIDNKQARVIEMNVAPTKQSEAPPPGTGIDFSISPPVLLTAAGLMLIGCWLAWYFVWRPFPVDSAISHYTKVDNVSGDLVSVGSDTLTDVMVLCSREFRKIYPQVAIQLEDKGSATAPRALIAGRSRLAP
jgi:ABC-type phosphate transport system substrate-binding protein